MMHSQGQGAVLASLFDFASSVFCHDNKQKAAYFMPKCCHMFLFPLSWTSCEILKTPHQVIHLFTSCVWVVYEATG